MRQFWRIDACEPDSFVLNVQSVAVVDSGETGERLRRRGMRKGAPDRGGRHRERRASSHQAVTAGVCLASSACPAALGDPSLLT